MSRGAGFKQASKPVRKTSKAPAARSTLKSKGPRMTPARKAARGQDCTLLIPGACNHDPATSVLCHSPYLADGRGMGLKSPDSIAAIGCSCCHDVLDGRRPRPPGVTPVMVEGAFYSGVARTQEIFTRMGIHSE